MKEKCGHCPLLNDERFCEGQRNTNVCDKADPASPSHNPDILTRLLNFTAAVVQHVAAGMPRASDEAKAARLAICQGCEHFDTERAGCRLCGCSMDIKAGWAEQRCPLEPPKWEAVEGVTSQPKP